ncbi:MAG TPA: hypothetical protein VEL76_35880 [Gemmataceae bacterium]|nr:hypothetical protein [Gemmataceae bacterium]
MALLRCTLSEGPRPGFTTVGIPSIEGRYEYLTIEDNFLAKRGNDRFLPVFIVGRDPRYDTALVELPDEADSGAQRVWVRWADLIPKPGEVPA